MKSRRECPSKMVTMIAGPQDPEAAQIAATCPPQPPAIDPPINDFVCTNCDNHFLGQDIDRDDNGVN
jgi:hypothetical protein